MKLVRMFDLADADARGFFLWLNDQWQTEAFGGRDQIGLALDPQPFRRRQTLCFPDALGAQLVHRQCRREHAAAGVRNMLQFERSLHDAIFATGAMQDRSEEHTSELQSLMRISYAVFCLKKKKIKFKKNNKTSIKNSTDKY